MYCIRIEYLFYFAHDIWSDFDHVSFDERSEDCKLSGENFHHTCIYSETAYDPEFGIYI